MNSNLDDAIERLYSVFERYPLITPVKGCECCVMPEDIFRLQAKPLRALTAEDLSKYAMKALTTWGDEDDFRHFLPRLFEFAAEQFCGRGHIIDPHILFGKLPYGNWNEWPAQEQNVIREYLDELWRAVLATEGNAEDCLTSIAQTGDKLAPYLDYWAYSSGSPGIRSLVKFGEGMLRVLNSKGKICGVFWGEREAEEMAVTQWLWSEPVLTRLETYSVESVGEVGSERAMDLAGYLRALRPE